MCLNVNLTAEINVSLTYMHSVRSKAQWSSLIYKCKLCTIGEMKKKFRPQIPVNKRKKYNKTKNFVHTICMQRLCNLIFLFGTYFLLTAPNKSDYAGWSTDARCIYGHNLNYNEACRWQLRSSNWFFLVASTTAATASRRPL